MTTMSLEDLQLHLPEVIDGLKPGKSLIITKEGEPVASLTKSESKQWPCKAGSAKSRIYLDGSRLRRAA